MKLILNYIKNNYYLKSTSRFLFKIYCYWHVFILTPFLTYIKSK